MQNLQLFIPRLPSHATTGQDSLLDSLDERAWMSARFLSKAIQVSGGYPCTSLLWLAERDLELLTLGISISRGGNPSATPTCPLAARTETEPRLCLMQMHQRLVLCRICTLCAL
jgi:hypothetical protein